MKEARELRVVCREFRDNVEVTPFDDLVSPIGTRMLEMNWELYRLSHCIRLWRESFPAAISACFNKYLQMPPLLRNADFVFFRGLRTLHISCCGGFTDDAFVHLQGVDTLDVSHCMDDISDAAFRHLRGIRHLTMDQYYPTQITDAALTHLRGIETLIVGSGHQFITTSGCEQLQGIKHLEVVHTIHPLHPLCNATSPDIPAILRAIEWSDPMWIHARDTKESSPLHWTSKRGLIAVVQCLLAQGANPVVKDIRNNTPLHEALRYGHVEIAHLLLRYGAELHGKNHVQKTPIDYAIAFAKKNPLRPELDAFIHLYETKE
jgi:hypothetical protein